MAGSLNKVMLIGNVGRDPEMRYTPGGTAVTNFSVATNHRVRKGEQWEDQVEWHNIVTFDKLAEQSNEYLSKGRKVYIEGRLQTRSWDDDESGQKKYRTEIVANQMVMLDQRTPDAEGGGEARSSAPRSSGGGGQRSGGGRPSGGAARPRAGADRQIELDETPF
jgi:single-strand DNA-binding protein